MLLTAPPVANDTPRGLEPPRASLNEKASDFRLRTPP